MQIPVFILLILLCALIRPRGISDWPAWFLLSTVLTAAYSIKLWLKSHWLLALTFLYVSMSGLFISQFDANQFAGHGELLFQTAQTHAVQSLTCLFLLSLLVFASGQALTNLLKAFGPLSLINSVMMLCQLKGFGDFGGADVGLLASSGLSASFSAVLIPMTMAQAGELFKLGGWIPRVLALLILVIPVAAIILAQAGIAYVTLVVALLMLYVPHLMKLKYRWAIIGIVVIFVFLGARVSEPYYFSSLTNLMHADRFEIYGAWMQDWIHNYNQMVGSGLGMVEVLARLGEMNIWNNGYKQIHSDVLQTLFELGAIGLLLLLSLVALVLRKTWESPLLFAIAAGALVPLTLSYPLHSALFCLLYATLLVLPLRIHAQG